MNAKLHITVSEIVKNTNGKLLYGDDKEKISSINTDSRKIEEEGLFIPIVGENFDGHDYIEQLAKSNSIKAFLTNNTADEKIAEKYNCIAILVENTLYALGKIAGSYKDKFNIPVVGITGTNGKTTTKEILASLLSEKYNCLKNEKNYNNEIGVPFTLMGLSDSNTAAVVEMGMNHSGEIERLSNIVKPDISIITNVGEGHLEFLGSVENVAYAKAEIMQGMREDSLIFLNKDSHHLEILIEQANKKGLKIKTYGIENGADIVPDSYKLYTDKIELEYKNNKFVVPLYGIHNLYNIMCSIACAEELGVSFDQMQKAFSKFKNADKRGQILEKGFIVINDTYNSNPLSLRSGLRSLKEIYNDRNKVAILSDMNELGDLSEYYHKEAGKEVEQNKFTRLYTWGKMAHWIAEGAVSAGMSENSVKHFTNKDELITEVLKQTTLNDVILVKGSRSTKMEEVAESLIR